MSNSSKLAKKIEDTLGPVLFRKKPPTDPEVLNVTPPKAQGPKQQKPLQSNVIMNEDPNSSKLAPALGVSALAATPMMLSGDTEQPELASKEELKAAEPIAQDVDKSLSAALKHLEAKSQASAIPEKKPETFKAKPLNLSDVSSFEGEKAEREAADEASKRVSAATETAMKEYTNTVRNIQNLYRSERDELKRQEIWEGLIHAAGLIAAGVYGMRSGVDMSGVKFNPTNWQAKIAESREHMNSMLDQAEKEMGAAYKNMELTERTRDKLLDNAYRAWQARNSTIEQNNRRKQAEWDAWKQMEIMGVSKAQAETALEISRQQLNQMKAKQAEIAASGISPDRQKEMQKDQQDLLKAMQGIEKAAKYEDDEMRIAALKLYKTQYDKFAAKYGMQELALETIEPGWIRDSIREIKPSEAIEAGGELMKSMTPGINKAPIMTEADRQALEWANKNPSDPRAVKIKERLGVQ